MGYVKCDLFSENQSHNSSKGMVIDAYARIDRNISLMQQIHCNFVQPI